MGIFISMDKAKIKAAASAPVRRSRRLCGLPADDEDEEPSLPFNALHNPLKAGKPTKARIRSKALPKANAEDPTSGPKNFLDQPVPLRTMILEELYLTCKQEGAITWPYAPVCQEWQEFFEKKHFARIVLSRARVVQLDSYVTKPRRALVDHIW